MKTQQSEATTTALIIFVRNPILGKVKTRLAATLGPENALAIYKQLLQHTNSITQTLPYHKYVYYADTINDNDLWENNIFYKHLQQGDDLGDRMSNAFSDLFNKGYTSICIIGSDCMALNTVIITQAFNQLLDHDTVIGPSVDGGYYLLGINQMIPGIFDGKNWSTNEVLPATLANIKTQQLSCYQLPVLSDVDTEEDWKRHCLAIN